MNGNQCHTSQQAGTNTSHISRRPQVSCEYFLFYVTRTKTPQFSSFFTNYFACFLHIGELKNANYGDKINENLNT